MLLNPESGARFRLRGAPIIHDTIDNETIAINQRTGAYYSIDGAGALVWDRLASGATAAELADHLAEAYDGERAVIESAVAAFLEELATEELIVRDERAEHSGNGSPPARGSGGRVEFTGLRLQRYTDLEVMLLADPIHEVDDAGWPVPLADSRE